MSTGPCANATSPTDDFFAALMLDSNFQHNEGGNLDFCVWDGDVDSYGPPCGNCGAAQWDLRESRGDLVCFNCGACDGGISKLVPDRTVYDEFEGLGEAPVDQGALNLATVFAELPARKVESNYDRGYYYHRRIKQWFIDDGNIPKHDWKIIKQAFRAYARGTVGVEKALVPSRQQLRDARGKQIPGTILLARADIRVILHDCEPLRQDTLAWRWESEERKKPSFVKRYFKHWLQIRWRFSGVVSSAEKNSARFLEKLHSRVRELQKAFPHIREAAKRKSFPSLNMVMRRLFVYLKMNDVEDEDFEQLRTRKARRKFEFCWWELCKYLQWPYLSNESFFLTRKQRSRNGSGK